MAILQKASSLNVATAPSSTIQPISTQADAIAAQQEALSAVDPKTQTDSLAVVKQQQLLSNYQTIEQQQTVVSTAYVGTSRPAVVSTGATAASMLAEIRALATVENRDKLIAAVRYGVDMWRLQAHFCNITIMGQTAIGNPGCLQGPSIKPWILQAPGVYSASGSFRTLVNAVAEAVDVNFSLWQNGVTVPGLPWYPMFVAVAAPFAPPVPNIPMPLMVCVSQFFNRLSSPTQIDSQIKTNLPNDFRIAEMDTFTYTLSAQLANSFLSWMCSQNVMMVMGMGPVPTFNPPYVPVGPVVNGYVIPSPGHLAA